MLKPKKKKKDIHIFISLIKFTKYWSVTKPENFSHGLKLLKMQHLKQEMCGKCNFPLLSHKKSFKCSIFFTCTLDFAEYTNWFHQVAINTTFKLLPWFFYSSCKVIKWQAELAETTGILQSFLQSTEEKSRCSSAFYIAFTLVCGQENQYWPWSSTPIIFLTSTKFIVLHIIHRNCKQVKLD